MKKLIALSALCAAAFAFAQEPAAPEAAAPAAAPVCACAAGKPCTCGENCACGPACKCCWKGGRKGPEGRGEFRRHPKGGPRHERPRLVKCTCCPECKGYLLPERPEGRPGCPFAKGPKGPEGEGCGCGKGPKPPRGEGAPVPPPPPAAEAPEAPAPEAPAAE